MARKVKGIRFTEKELEIIDTAASTEGVSRSEFVRYASKEKAALVLGETDLTEQEMGGQDER